MSRRRRREYDDDDGRTIADMSDMGESPNPITGGAPHPTARPGREVPQRPAWMEENPLTLRERLGMVWMALRAALLIGLAFLVGLGLIIVLMILFWG